MSENKYLDEEKYQMANRKVKKIGKVLLIMGIIILVVSFLMMILGFIGFGNTAVSSIENHSLNSVATQNADKSLFGSAALFALSQIAGFIGFALATIGGFITIIAHRREIAAYSTQQSMPIVQEKIEKMTPTVAKSAGEIAKSVKQGLNDADNE